MQQLTENLPYLIGGFVILILLIGTVWGLLSRYRRCPSDKLLVVFGKNKTITKEEEYKDENGNIKTRSVTLTLPAKIIQGGGTFVIPIIQDYREMSLRPILLSKKIEGVSSQMIKTFVSIELSVAIGSEEELRVNAASRFLSATESEIRNAIEAIYVGEVRSLMARLTIEDLNSDREAFLSDAKRNIEIELQKVGFIILNINISDLDDDADYITNLGQKAATQAKATAEADIAEQQKIGEVKIANTTKEKAIQLATAQKEQEVEVAEQNKDREINVNDRNKQKEVKVAEINKEKAVSLANFNKDQEIEVAEATKEKESKIAEKKAETEINKAKAIAKQEAESQEAEFKKDSQIEQSKSANEILIAEAKSNKRIQSAEFEKKAGVAEQNAKIEVAAAEGQALKAEANRDKTAGLAKVEAEQEVEKLRQTKLAEVNEARAKAKEKELDAEIIVQEKKEKEKIVIQAEANKEKAIKEAEGEAEAILLKAQKEAEGIKVKKLAEAEGEKAFLMAQAEGKKASLMAEADKEIAIGMIPAQVVEKMREAGMTPEMIISYKTVDQLQGIAGAQAQMFEHIHLGNIAVYGNENTAGKFMASLSEQLNPAFQLLGTIPFKKTIEKLIDPDKEETKTEPAEVVDQPEQTTLSEEKTDEFEDVDSKPKTPKDKEGDKGTTLKKK